MEFRALSNAMLRQLLKEEEVKCRNDFPAGKEFHESCHIKEIINIVLSDRYSIHSLKGER
ncbi:MAG: hypothetical protein MRJ65_02845 [Candidatus Brocadiaceae bacterium]|nr:hypothetical protein [Candidatus Brocadiaceae bacterium]